MEMESALKLMSSMVVGHQWFRGGVIHCFCGDVIGLYEPDFEPDFKDYFSVIDKHLDEHGGIENHMVEVAYGEKSRN